MARYNGIVTDVQFNPMVVVLSYLDITINIPALHTSIQLHERDTIENLSNRFGFIIVADDHWDLRPMYDRACEVDITNGIETFIRYT